MSLFKFKPESKSHCIERLTSENMRLKNDIKYLTDKLDAIQRDLDATPEDCKPGRYCRICEFGEYHHIINTDGSIYYSFDVCGKAMACKNFVERKEK